MKNWQVKTGADCSPLAWLVELLPNAPHAYLRQLLRTGRIGRDGQVLTEADRLRPGDAVTLPDSERLRQLLAEAQTQRLDVLLETDRLLVLNKPSGLAVHPAPGWERDNLQFRAALHLQRQRQRMLLAPVNRLDRGTSGAVLFGKGRQALAALAAIWPAATTRKTYLALVQGTPPTEGQLDTPVTAKGKLKAASASFRRLTQAGKWALLELQLGTGRTHQLRRQLAAIGCPVAGDDRYGGAEVAIGRLCLHARELQFVDPWSGKLHQCQAALPEDLLELLTKLGLMAPARDTAESLYFDENTPDAWPHDID